MPKYFSQPHSTIEVFVNGHANVAIKTINDVDGDVVIALSVQQACWLLKDLPELIERAKASARDLYVGDDDAEPFDS